MALVGKKKHTAVDDTRWTIKRRDGVDYIEAYEDHVVLDTYAEERANVCIDLTLPNTGNTKVSEKFSIHTPYLIGTLDFNGNPLEPHELKTTYMHCRNINLIKGLNKGEKSLAEVFVNVNLEQIELPEGVENLSRTFICSTLKKFPKLGDSVTSLYETFRDCYYLSNVTDIPDSVINMSKTFAKCLKLRAGARTMPTRLKSMYYTYFDCIRLTSTGVIPDSVENLDGTFQGCSRLKNVSKLPSNLKLMIDTFNRCISLEKAPKIPEGVLNMTRAFSSTGIIRAPKLPSTVNRLNSAFASCKKLKVGADIPEKVVSADFCYHACPELSTPVKLGASLVTCVNMFAGCVRLTKATDLPDSVVHAQEMYKNTGIHTAPKLSKNLEGMSGMFWNCPNLYNLPIIPPKVTEAGAAFGNCPNINDDLIILSPHIDWVLNPPVDGFGFFSHINDVYMPKYQNGRKTKTYSSYLTFISNFGKKERGMKKVKDITEHLDYEEIKKEYIDG